MTDVYCPNCGAVLPYSVFAKQVAKRKHNRNLIVQIIERNGKITTGELAKQYQLLSGTVVSLRHVHNIIKELEEKGLVVTRPLNMGRYGKTTLIQVINNTDLTSITSSYVHHV